MGRQCQTQPGERHKCLLDPRSRQSKLLPGVWLLWERQRSDEESGG